MDERLLSTAIVAKVIVFYSVGIDIRAWEGHTRRRFCDDLKDRGIRGWPYFLLERTVSALYTDILAGHYDCRGDKITARFLGRQYLPKPELEELAMSHLVAIRPLPLLARKPTRARLI